MDTNENKKPQKNGKKGKKIENEGFSMQEGGDRRDTFVGTPLYVSPEMLEDTKSTPASDLWALGCIIYRMHVGKVPFADETEARTFEKILKLWL